MALLTAAFITLLLAGPSLIAGGHILTEQPLSEYPLWTLPSFSKFRILLTDTSSSVIMKKYVHLDPDTSLPKNTKYVRFVPSAASFKKFRTDVDFCNGLDVLTAGGNVAPGKPYLSFELHRQARVFVVLNGGGPRYELLKELSQGRSDIQGLPTGWYPTPILLETKDSNREILPSSRTDSPIVGEVPDLPKFGVAFEVALPEDLKLTLPSPRTVLINGMRMGRYHILFAQPITGDNLLPIEAPPVPPPFMSLLDPTVLVYPSQNVPKPNGYCPEWVHDIYVTPSRSGGESLGEPSFWRTWHPMVDPVYWCYFDHEHGDHPGQGYRPMFGYTAWKTPDDRTSHGRQDESHKGFKVISFKLSDGRYAVFTVHSHLSRPGRFLTRHHTVIFAVLSTSGMLEMEIHLKMDFGPLLVLLSSRELVAVDSDQQKIREELKGKRVGRRVNIANIDENYPSSVDRRFFVDMKPNSEDIKGLYEAWSGRFPTCVDQDDEKAVLRFDIRDPATALRFPKKYKEMSSLKGLSSKRTLRMREHTFDRGLCFFGGRPLTTEVFYTNPYFNASELGPGPNAVRQFIKEGFQSVQIEDGILFPSDYWCGPHVYGSQGVNPINIDNAINKNKN